MQEYKNLQTVFNHTFFHPRIVYLTYPLYQEHTEAKLDKGQKDGS